MRTAHHNTQQGIKKILHPSLSRQLKTNDQALSLNRLHHNVLTNTIQEGNVSRRENLYSQVYLTNCFGQGRT